MEDPRVFHAAHTKMLQLIAEGKVTGLRIDHPDGLLDPAVVLSSASSARRRMRTTRDSGTAESAPASTSLAEKILRRRRSCCPTTGRSPGRPATDFSTSSTACSSRRRIEEIFRSIYARLTGRRESFEEVAYHGKRLVMGSSMASELGVLARALKTIAGSDRRTRDFTLTALRKAIVEVVACFPVYRTYVTTAGFSATDRETIDVAIDRARRRNPVMAQSLFLFLRSVLLADDSEHGRACRHPASVRDEVSAVQRRRSRPRGSRTRASTGTTR